MSQFEFIAVLVSIVTGLGIVRLLSGFARFISAGTKPYWVHLLWTWNVFHFIVFYWWFFWRWSAITEWNLLLFLFVLIFAVVLYLLCALLYPTEAEGRDYEQIFFENRKWFFSLWILTMLIDVIDTRWKVLYGLSGISAVLFFVWGSIIAGSAVAIHSSSRKYHAAWSVVFFMIMSTVEYLNWSTLRAE